MSCFIYNLKFSSFSFSLNPSQELLREAMPHEQPANREKNDEPAATTCSLSSVSKEPEVITLGIESHHSLLNKYSLSAVVCQ